MLQLIKNRNVDIYKLYSKENSFCKNLKDTFGTYQPTKLHIKWGITAQSGEISSSSLRVLTRIHQLQYIHATSPWSCKKRDYYAKILCKDRHLSR